MTTFDIYQENILHKCLGPILSPKKALQALSRFPTVPKDLSEIPFHLRMHLLMQIRNLHIPSQAGADLYATIDMMIRQGYSYKNPNDPATWRNVAGEKSIFVAPKSPALSAAAVGISGAGKTEATHRALSMIPHQLFHHESFPNTVNGLTQINWISVDVASSGKSADLATNLMIEWDRITGGDRFTDSLAKPRRDGMHMLNEWRQVAASHFLGLLHLDEVQNFFKIPSLERRRKGKTNESLELSIVEDALLKWILSLTNTWQIPVLFTGTPDGIGALTKRFSTSQRLVTCGYHRIAHFENSKDRKYTDFFLKKLFEYQYVSKKLELSSEIADLIFQLTGGVQRIIIALWISAHRVAFQRESDDLRADDFKIAANTYLRILRPAIEAVLSGDPSQLSRFEDLCPKDDNFWAGFWSTRA